MWLVANYFYSVIRYQSVVVAYSLLAYNIDIFQIVFQRISLLTFSKILLSNVTRDSILCQNCP